MKAKILDLVPKECKLSELDRCALKVNLESFNRDINRFQLDKLIANDEPISLGIVLSIIITHDLDQSKPWLVWAVAIINSNL